MGTDLVEIYGNRYEGLQTFAEHIESDLRHMFEGVQHIDRIYARAKSPDRFLEKANRKDAKGGMKYSDPLSQIQDQVGARIITYYTDDLPAAEQRVREVYNNIERQAKSPSLVDQFGYEGVHFIVHIPPELRPLRDELNIGINFFELQIKTLYQHAWSEASHDIAYKPGDAPLTHQENRVIAYTAALSWGADEAFEQVRRGVFFKVDE